MDKSFSKRILVWTLILIVLSGTTFVALRIAHAQEEATSTPREELPIEALNDDAENIVGGGSVASTTEDSANIEEVENQTSTTTPDNNVPNNTSTTTPEISVPDNISTTTPENSTPEENGVASTTPSEVGEPKIESPQPISLLLKNKSAQERANIKGHEIAKHDLEGVHDSVLHNVRIEIIGDITEIEGGVQLFARAWKNGKQLGFGRDGTVEIERFLIYNPPILVDDPNGDIVREWKEEDAVTKEVTPRQRKLREDPVEAILQVMVDNVALIGKEDTNIIKNKIGNTTSTFFPDAFTETTSVDGSIKFSNSDNTWSTVRGASAGHNAYPSDSITNFVGYLSGESTGWEELYRAFVLFDTSPIPDNDVISSATLSIYGQSKSDGLGNAIEAYIVTTTPASNTDLVVGDFDQVGSVRQSDTDISYSSWDTTGYNDYVLNSTGRNNISLVGVSKFGAIEKKDFSNTEPSRPSNSTQDRLRAYMADELGTTKDPKLVVEHGVGPPAPGFQDNWYVGDGKDGTLNLTSLRTEDTTQGIENITSTATSSQKDIIVADGTTFAADDWVLIMQMTGTGAGNYEQNQVNSISSNTLTMFGDLQHTYQSSGAQVIKMGEYDSVSININGIWTASEWNGTKGGVLAAMVSGGITVTSDGVVDVVGKGFSGGAGVEFNFGVQGTSHSGSPSNSGSANGIGGGGGDGSGQGQLGGGGGGGYSVGGSTGGGDGGTGGGTVGTTTLETVFLGGGGGGGGEAGVNSSPGAGGKGGGVIILIVDGDITVQGSISAEGGQGLVGAFTSAGGGGSGGSIRFIADGTIALGSSNVSAAGGAGGSPTGGAGGDGRIATISTATVTGSASPTINASSTESITASNPFNAGPGPASSLQTEGATNPTDIADTTPEFSAIYEDTDVGDIANHYQIQVSISSSDFGSPYWDTTKTALASSTPEGQRIADISYEGNPLARQLTYFWRIKFWDEKGLEGSWSTTTASFTIEAETLLSASGIQNLTFTYDSVGNILGIDDFSNTNSFKILTFTYDDLYRLLSASTTAATTTPFFRTYTYDSLGNITNKSDLGNYTYGETGFTNPHAVTSIGGITYTYDKNGNVTGIGSDSYTWDYRNRLNSSTVSSNLTLYEYDFNNIRTAKGDGTATTTYANAYYNVKGATTTKHILGPDGELLATIESTGGVAKTYYIHTDHLGGTAVVTDEDGEVVQTLDYYPFGETRVNTKAAGFDEQQKFTGHEYDEDTDLTYAKARYLDQDIGKFLSQDLLVRHIPQIFIGDPQLLNAYSYVRNNPLMFYDPTGLLTVVIPGSKVSGDRGLDTDSGQEFISNIGETFGEDPLFLDWSGINTQAGFEQAADSFAGFINQYNFSDGEQLNIVGHSQGGNIANLITSRVNHKVNNLVTLGTPVRSSAQPLGGNVGSHFNVYSRFDRIQRLGEIGDPLTITGVDPRQYKGATNIGVGLRAGIFPRGSHTNLWQNSSVWSLVDSLVGSQ